MLALRLLSEGVEGPNTEFQWLLLVGITFFFLLIAIGWWTSSRKQEQANGTQDAKIIEKNDVENPSKARGTEKLSSGAKNGRKVK